MLNPRDAKGRIIKENDNVCWIAPEGTTKQGRVCFISPAIDLDSVSVMQRSCVYPIAVKASHLHQSISEL